jgi:hypothetical protein
MSEARTGGSDSVAILRNAAMLGPADWLSLAAAPTFAIMALLTGVLDRHAPDMLCLTVHGASPLGGMVPMYLAMSVFHLTPWLKVGVFRRRLGA